MRRALAFLLAIPVVVALGIAILAPASPSGFAYLIAACLLVVAVALEGVERRRLAGVGLALLLGTALLRLALADGVTTSDGSGRLVNRLLDERDGTIPAGIALVESGALPADAREFVAALRSAYGRYRESAGVRGTPAIATWLGLQSAERFDLVEFGDPDAKRAVVFLHGYAGNFGVYCWQFHEASRVIDARTVCPSVGPSGLWHTKQGRDTVRATLDRLHDEGVTEVWLAGLSNGGFGASRLAPRFRSSLRGLILVSGVDPDALGTGLPTLVVHGRRDSMAGFGAARTYARRARATLVPRPGGHFGFLDDWEGYEAAIADWLRQQI